MASKATFFIYLPLNIIPDLIEQYYVFSTDTIYSTTTANASFIVKMYGAVPMVLTKHFTQVYMRMKSFDMYLFSNKSEKETLYTYQNTTYFL